VFKNRKIFFGKICCFFAKNDDNNPRNKKGDIMKDIKLFPSDFAFLWEQCPRCFWLQAIKGIKRPSIPMPSIFMSIDRQMKESFVDKNLSDINPDWIDGRVVGSDIWVKSLYKEYPERDLQLYISGKLDTLVRLEDNSYGIIDFKTSDALKFLPLYMRQLHAYAYAFNNPQRENFDFKGRITQLGLIIFDPCNGFDISKPCEAALNGTITYKSISFVPDKFDKFLDKIAGLVAEEDEPDYNSECAWCQRDYIIKYGQSMEEIDE
jgi:hypothetical protein